VALVPGVAMLPQALLSSTGAHSIETGTGFVELCEKWLTLARAMKVVAVRGPGPRERVWTSCCWLMIGLGDPGLSNRSPNWFGPNGVDLDEMISSIVASVDDCACKHSGFLLRARPGATVQ
jgi:hypothetical protein